MTLIPTESVVDGSRYFEFHDADGLFCGGVAQLADGRWVRASWDGNMWFSHVSHGETRGGRPRTLFGNLEWMAFGKTFPTLAMARMSVLRTVRNEIEHLERMVRDGDENR